MLNIKSGVNAARLGPDALRAAFFVIVERVFDKHGYECTITAGIDGKHSPGSLHYVGLAWDIRSNIIPKNDQEEIRLELKTRLGDDFDVVVEGDHYHVEIQPKSPYTGT